MSVMSECRHMSKLLFIYILWFPPQQQEGLHDIWALKYLEVILDCHLVAQKVHLIRHWVCSERLTTNMCTMLLLYVYCTENAKLLSRKGVFLRKSGFINL